MTTMMLSGVLLAIVASSGAKGATVAAPAMEIGCASPDRQMTELVRYLKTLVSATTPDLIRVRNSIAVPAMDSALVRPIYTRALCRQAGVLLNRNLHLADTASRVVYLAQIGDRYWAEERTVPGEHYIVGLVIDRTLTRVLAHPGR